MQKFSYSAKSLNDIKVFLFDLDGTLYLGDKVYEGAQDSLSFLREKGKRIIFLTNNSSRTNEEYYKRLKKIGLCEKGDIVYSSLDSFIDYASEYEKSAKVYVLADNKVKRYLKDRGINVVSAKNADMILTTFDKTINYKKIVETNNLLRSGAKYVATHPDIVCPAKPYPLPDLGSFTQMFKLSSGREPDIITGKPFNLLAECLIKKLNVLPEEIAMVGDRLSTDIAFGVNAGFKTILVFSGETDKNIYNNSSIKADYAIDSVNDLINLF